MFLLFGAFILLCGTTHLIEAVIFWWPIYPVAGAVKFATAVASWGRVVTLAPVVRDALTQRSPAQLDAEVAARTAELKSANERLAAEAAEHRRTLDSLHRTEERLRLALEAGEMGAWEWDLSDNRVEWTPGLDAMHGLAPGAFGGTLDSFVALVHEDDRPQLESDLEIALREGTQFTTEFRTRRIDGTEGWVTGIGRAHYEADGRPVRMVGVGLDVTTRRQAEEAARCLADAGRVRGDIVSTAPCNGWPPSRSHGSPTTVRSACSIRMASCEGSHSSAEMTAVNRRGPSSTHVPPASSRTAPGPR